MQVQKYTREKLEPLVRESFSMMQVIRKLGMKWSGGTQAHISKRVRELGLDTTHFLGKGSNRGAGHVGPKVRWQEVLTLQHEERRTKRKAPQLYRAILEAGISEECAECTQKPFWNGRPLRLQVDHRNGNPLDHRIENVRFLCPNCHTQTENWGSKNKTHGSVA